jgi:glutamyl-tRNA synthetase
MSSVYANNRDLVDDDADRYFLVRDRDDDPAVELPVVDGDAPAPEAGHPPLHPEYPDRGDREVPAGRVVVESADLPPEGERVWLKGYGCVRHAGDELTFVDADIDVVRDGDVDVVHWAPADEGVETLLRTVSGDVRGIAEPAVADAATDDVVQFERVGFARIDAFEPAATDEPDGPDGDEDLLAYYAHP